MQQDGKTRALLARICLVVAAVLFATPERSFAGTAVGMPNLAEVAADRRAPASPECLRQLGILRFDAFRNVIHCMQAWTEYNTVTCAHISTGSYQLLTQPRHGTVSIKIIGPYHLANGDCPDKTYNFKLASYNWTDTRRNVPEDPFTMRWHTPDGLSAGPWREEPVLAPRIRGRREVWWFDGVRPNEGTYPTRITLTTEPAGYTYQWRKILEGEGDVDLIRQNATQVRARSSAASDGRQDICVTARTDVSGPSNPFCLTVLAPTLDYVGAHDIPATDFGRPVGYSSQIRYRIRDQFGTVLPAPIPWNEQFTPGTWVRDFVCGPGLPPPCPNWNRGGEVGGTVNPNNAIDHVSIWANGPNVLRPNARFPPAGSDALTCASPGQVEIDHWDGRWRIGSAVAGQGVLAERLTWQRYWNHARHCNQVFPPP
jgi:hypothetical protein